MMVYQVQELHTVYNLFQVIKLVNDTRKFSVGDMCFAAIVLHLHFGDKLTI